jgi:ABC-type bacteriocin/lantibiotic exporter with double-glycine peptidase domain
MIILAYGARWCSTARLSLGTMLGLNAVAAGFLGPLGNLVATATQLQLLGSYLERIDDVMKTPPEQDRPRCASAAAQGADHAREGVVPLRPGGAAGGERRVGRHPAGAVRRHRRAQRLGEIDAGAPASSGSTRRPSGRILYDSMDLSELEVRSVRRQMGIVPQAPFLFGQSSAPTSPHRPVAALEAIVEAARLAHIHDDIVAMPMGYETLLLDGGASLSGGQRSAWRSPRAGAQAGRAAARRGHQRASTR